MKKLLLIDVRDCRYELYPTQMVDITAENNLTQIETIDGDKIVVNCNIKFVEDCINNCYLG